MLKTLKENKELKSEVERLQSEVEFLKKEIEKLGGIQKSPKNKKIEEKEYATLDCDKGEAGIEYAYNS